MVKQIEMVHRRPIQYCWFLLDHASNKNTKLENPQKCLIGIFTTYFVKHLNLHAKGKYPTFVVGFFFTKKRLLRLFELFSNTVMMLPIPFFRKLHANTKIVSAMLSRFRLLHEVEATTAIENFLLRNIQRTRNLQSLL